MITGKRVCLLFAGLFFGAACMHSVSAQDSAAAFTPRIARYSYNAIPRDPLASAFFSTVIPASGQLYNREFGRAAVTGAAFYTGAAVTWYMMNRWTVLNTDTFYIAETDSNGILAGHRRIIFPRYKQIGLPGDEKAVLLGAAVITVASYVYNIIDAYRGAERFNSNLYKKQMDGLSLIPSWSPLDNTAALEIRYRF